MTGPMNHTTRIQDGFDEVAKDIGWLLINAQQQAGNTLAANTHARSTAPVSLKTAEPVSAVSPVSRQGMSVMGNFMVIGIDHLKQSISDILNTPIGSRVMRREYGSVLPDLIDQPMNQRGKMRLYAATAGAIKRWEPRVALKKMVMDASALMNGRLKLTLVWILRPEYHWMLQPGQSELVMQEVLL